jgi:hypothetical protein
MAPNCSSRTHPKQDTPASGADNTAPTAGGTNTTGNETGAVVLVAVQPVVQVRRGVALTPVAVLVPENETATTEERCA